MPRAFKPLLDPGGGLTSETAARRQKRNGRCATVSEVKRLQIYNGYVLDPCGLAARSDPPVVPSGPLGVSPDPPLCPPVLVVFLCPPVL
jgi:hypothetical protein